MLNYLDPRLIVCPMPRYSMAASKMYIIPLISNRNTNQKQLCALISIISRINSYRNNKIL